MPNCRAAAGAWWELSSDQHLIISENLHYPVYPGGNYHLIIIWVGIFIIPGGNYHLISIIRIIRVGIIIIPGGNYYPGGKASRANLEPCPSGFVVIVAMIMMVMIIVKVMIMVMVMTNITSKIITLNLPLNTQRLLPICWLVLLWRGNGLRLVCDGPR